ncbi:hypothetical protein BH18ACT7_BH18ACT7_10910 [soil metagenome]
MRRLLFSPRWILGHLLAVAAFATCLWFGWWQLARFDSPTGGPQNAAYALQWPVFAGFVAFFWYRAVRDGLRAEPGPKPPRLVAQPSAATQERIRQDEERDPQLAAYNRYLADLHERHAGTD